MEGPQAVVRAGPMAREGGVVMMPWVWAVGGRSRSRSGRRKVLAVVVVVVKCMLRETRFVFPLVEILNE